MNAWAQQVCCASADVLMGYSLGGRLALHALLQEPQRWRGAIIVSAHPGLVDAEERQKRYKQDCLWAQRFRQESWQELMTAWNQQPVLQTSCYHFLRHEKDYQRETLAYVLEHASLGLQNDLRPLLSKIEVPILWITGADDILHHVIDFKHPLSSCTQIIHAGHRVPWDQPHLFEICVQEFLNQLYKS
jgi:2-succinyl-6-hydroxy-2,4-cyclohexadiene-1-carboxylate synthase